MKQSMGNSVFTAMLVMLGMMAGLPAMSQADTSTVSWQKASYEKVSFKYPKDWVFDKQTMAGSVVLSATHVELNDDKRDEIF